MDELKQHMEQRLVETGYATKDKNDEMCDIKISTREWVQGFIERALKFDGNPEVMFKWYKNSYHTA